MSTHALTAPTAPPAPLRAGRALLGLMGAVVVYGSIYFSAVNPPVEVDAIGWAVGAWALAMGVAFVVTAVRLGRGGEPVRRFAVRLLALHFVFGIVKVVGYDEPEAGTFMAVDALLIALLSRPAVRRWFG
jgi:hypothetical protein